MWEACLFRLLFKRSLLKLQDRNILINMKNFEIAKILYKIADILEFQNVEFKPVAYRRAANNIETMSEDIEYVYKQNKLEEIPGIGKNIAEKVAEIIESGKSKYFEYLKKQVPVDLDELMAIPEIGPKKVRLLYEKLNIRNIKDLKKAAESHKIQKLKKMGIKTEDAILRGIEFLEKNKGRMLLGYVLPITESLEKELKSLKEVEIVNVAGSVRRMKETVADIDVLVISKNPVRVIDFFTKLRGVKVIIAKGETKSSVRLDNGIQVDLRVVERKSYGAALNYFTGNKEHNVALRRIAQTKGLKLSEYGLFKKNRYVAGNDENEIYKTLGLKYIEPELRENTGEIEASKLNKLPRLIGYDEIKGDFHLHTKFSDGINTIEEMANAAKKLGYEYIAISDHSKLAVAGGMDDRAILNYIKKIDKTNVSNIKIFKSSEVNILKEGSLDLKNSTLKELDLVIGSVHSYFKQNKEETTKRLLKAMDNEYLTILGHPTGRLIGKRDAYEFDAEKIFEKARERNIIMEINSFPERLDLKDSLIKYAREFKVKFAINTDSHSTEHLHFIKLGVGQARRGWLESNDVINTYDLKKLGGFLGI